MTRRHNRIDVDWETPARDFRWEHVTIEVLMDIRKELRTLVGLLQCYRVPRALDAARRIDRRLAKRIKL